MTATLDTVLETLRTHEGELRRFGVSHASVFGSVARRETNADSDIDVLVELDQNRPLGIFEYARLKLYINEILNGAGDVVNRRSMPSKDPSQRLRDIVDNIDAIDAFTTKMDRDTFGADRKTLYAVIRALEIV